jgi:MFS family permease
VGLLAPVLLVTLRLVQGLALGGEYGGAATYVAEHVPDDRRGYYTSFIQTTATLGFFLSLGVIGACRVAYGPEGFKDHGWRVPFLASFALLAVCSHPAWMRSRPLRAPEDGGPSLENPPKGFGNPRNPQMLRPLRHCGAGVVWYRVSSTR